MDPLIGIADADAPIQDPREYYLRVFGARLAQVTGEWKLAVEKTENSVDKHNQVLYVSTASLSLAFTGDSAIQWWRKDFLWRQLFKVPDESRRCYPVSESTFGESSREAKEDFQTPKRSVADPLSEVERVLADDVHSRVFSGLPLCWPLFIAMEGELHELQRLQKALERVEKGLKTTAETLNSKLALEPTQHSLMTATSSHAMQIGHDSKILSLMMMLYISHFALAANFFSMDGKVMPFRPPNPRSFLGVLLFFAAMGALPLLVTWFSNRVLKWRGRIHSIAPLDELHLDLGQRRPPTTDEENRPG
ncbi:uncharacterized protein PV07_12770 [Cladophialophora immunda]|uniref:Uncharacterized protein n=1 Tax=Cladophialophora immunda TaxID=569365 RepID=A0A0D2BTQ4_9EURO|nr:uncharacterized protein PV07_12770 [Cladophialophora immunda]KIW21805.1 hypothetical protein PV07_12770 [Cladophialophora immunda]